MIKSITYYLDGRAEVTVTNSVFQRGREYASFPEVSNRLPKDGSQAMTGDLDMGGNDIQNIDPSSTTTLQKFLAIGSSNAQWISCPFEDSYSSSSFSASISNYNSTSSSNFWSRHIIPLPTTKGGKSLYIAEVEIYQAAADGNNYISNFYLASTNNGTETQHFYDSTDKTSTGVISYTFTDKDVGDEDIVFIKYQVVTSGNNLWKANYLKVKYYYA
jgi:hypothetical protein